jgi:hypothetical protein
VVVAILANTNRREPFALTANSPHLQLPPPPHPTPPSPWWTAFLLHFHAHTFSSGGHLVTLCTVFASQGALCTRACPPLPPCVLLCVVVQHTPPRPPHTHARPLPPAPAPQLFEERDAELQANEVTIAGLRAELEQCRGEARSAATARASLEATQAETIRRLTQEAAEAEV